MKLLVHSAASPSSIEQQLGMADYSYFFVKNLFLPVLARLGEVIDISDPAQEVDAIYARACAAGEFCLFFSFTPPHKTLTDLRCPSVCVFAWEYGTLPSEAWGDEPRNDWRYVLGRHGYAITHSAFAAATVRAALRQDFPVLSLPAPLWDAQQGLRQPPSSPLQRRYQLSLMASVIDSRTFALEEVSEADLPAFVDELLARAGQPRATVLDLEGVVYTAVFNPNDGRKNWFDLLSAFCWALREREDAILLIKLSYRDLALSVHMLFVELRKLAPFRCRVVLIHGFLSEEAYQGLIQASHYAVNSSHGEGQCLPLMEFMSAGKPAIAPDHTAMADYLDSDNAFVVASNREWTHWPHDPRALKRTFRYRIDWQSLHDAYQQSYVVAREDDVRYQHMSEAAVESLRAHCSQQVIHASLAAFIAQRHASHAAFTQDTRARAWNWQRWLCWLRWLRKWL